MKTLAGIIHARKTSTRCPNKHLRPLGDTTLIDIALANKEREVPEYLHVDEKNKKIKFVRTPKFEEVPYPVTMEPNLVIEYYSR